VQAEASFFNVPCLVARENTERPIYIEQGTSVLVGRNLVQVRDLVGAIERGEHKESTQLVKELGSGVAAKVVSTIVEYREA
jgi:UDP-N-acetylglucosamine 2-epimerase (non-hydrolysing)